MCIIDCLSTIVFILPLHLDYTKVIILILWWRNFQLEYWRTFQLVSTYKANSSYEKVGVLTEFLDRYRMLQMLFRVCVEQKVITERKYASFGLLLEKIGKQATSWKQYNERGMKKQEDKRQ